MKNSFVMVLVGVLVGAGVTYSVMTSTGQNSSSSMMSSGGSMSMNDMMGGLADKEGDEFDKAFLSEMIEHHEGAIDMAKEVPDSAKHEELKKLAEGIITAQTSEIKMMKQWQKDWGYTK